MAVNNTSQKSNTEVETILKGLQTELAKLSAYDADLSKKLYHLIDSSILDELYSAVIRRDHEKRVRDAERVYRYIYNMGGNLTRLAIDGYAFRVVDGKIVEDQCDDIPF